MKKTVIVVEDDRGLREQLTKILVTAPDIACVGAYASAEIALPAIKEKVPNVVLMDIKLPGMSGIQCVAEIKKSFPAMYVIMVTAYEESERIFHALKAGANGYIIKSDSPDQLLDAIRDVHKGGGPMSIPIARKVIQHFHQIGASPKETENLSPRELEVLELLAQGFIYKEIGENLKIGVTTVRTYVQNICHKMHVRSRLEAVAKHQNKQS
jgi:DNA-binding NarL/FixJ family response regulator